MLTRLLNRILSAALFFVIGAFFTLLAWLFMHQRRAPPFDGSIFDPGLGHRVLVVGSVFAVVEFVVHDFLGAWLRGKALESLNAPPPDPARFRRIQRILMLLTAIAAAVFFEYSHRG